jgi:hypothetical protein
MEALPLHFGPQFPEHNNAEFRMNKPLAGPDGTYNQCSLTFWPQARSSAVHV